MTKEVLDDVLEVPKVKKDDKKRGPRVGGLPWTISDEAYRRILKDQEEAKWKVEEEKEQWRNEQKAAQEAKKKETEEKKHNKKKKNSPVTGWGGLSKKSNVNISKEWAIHQPTHHTYPPNHTPTHRWRSIDRLQICKQNWFILISSRRIKFILF